MIYFSTERELENLEIGGLTVAPPPRIKSIIINPLVSSVGQSHRRRSETDEEMENVEKVKGAEKSDVNDEADDEEEVGDLEEEVGDFEKEVGDDVERSDVAKLKSVKPITVVSDHSAAAGKYLYVYVF